MKNRNMKIWIANLLTISTFLFITGCSGPQSPTFLKLENVKVASANRSKVVLKGNAVFHNPNNITGMLTNTKIKILVDGIEVTEVDQEHSIAVPQSGDFRVPLDIVFNPKKLLKENKGFLRSVIKNFVNKKMEVQYFGTVTVQVMGVSFDVPIDYSEKISFGINHE